MVTKLRQSSEMQIGIFIFDGAQELDFTGPWEVLKAWAREAQGEHEISVFTVASSKRPVRCSQGLRVFPTTRGTRRRSSTCSSFPGDASGPSSTTPTSTTGSGAHGNPGP